MLEAGPSAFETKRVALWAVPRSVSSAFERSFIERDDTLVLHEPFSHAYYHGPDRRSDRFGDREPEAAHAPATIVERTLDVADVPILFIKDMAYQVLPFVGPDFFGRITNTFLIRHPREALASLHRKWPDFDEEEAGYAAQAQLFDLVTGELGQDATVIDATDLRCQPEPLMRAYCEAIGVPFFESAMSWESGPVDLLEPWSEWHSEVEASTGIEPPQRPPSGRVPARLERLIKDALPHYERLFGNRLTI
jgi:Sulfotransferase domain